MNDFSQRSSLFSPATVIALAMSGLTVWGCSTDDIGAAASPVTASLCAGVQQDGCGAACEDDEGCDEGLYCGGGACTADCASGGETCGDDETCGPRGRCAAGDEDGDGLDSDAGGDTACAAVELSFKSTTPTVALLIDQSHSMLDPFTDSTSRWDAVRDAFMDPVDGVVAQLQDQVRFGLVLYNYRHGISQCPELVVANGIKLGNFDALNAVYQGQEPRADTPTGDAILAITPTFAAYAEPGPKLILLATDGGPDRCADKDDHGPISEKLATDATAAAYAQGIETVIVAVGREVDQRHQQDMANAGRGLAVPASAECATANAKATACAPTYEPAGKKALIDSFKRIIEGKRACSFELDGRVAEGAACEGTVTLNGAEVPCDDANGYRIVGGKQIEFSGKACESLMSDDKAELAASFACSALSEMPR